MECAECAVEKEYDRIRDLIRKGEIDLDNRLALTEIDGLVQFFRVDLIGFFYLDGSLVEELLGELVGRRRKT